MSSNAITLCEKPNYSVMQIQYCCPGYKTGFGANISRNELVIPEVDQDLFGGGSQSVVIIYRSTFERVRGGECVDNKGVVLFTEGLTLVGY